MDSSKPSALSPFAQRIFIILGTLLTLGLVAVVGTYLYFSSRLPKLDSLNEYRPPIVTSIFSSEGELMAEYYKERRYVVPFGHIPDIVINAFISSEDGSFFSHSGINFMRILQASYENLKAGRIVQGGSTITQQVAKTMLLTREKKISRKIKEAILASRMEKTFSKEEILYLYLNQIYLGHGAYGVEAAAKIYFRKNVKDLSLAEAAMIGGLPQAPSRYDPHRFPDRAKRRQAYVLRRMVAEGYITQEEADTAYQQPLKIYKAENITRREAPHYSEFVRRYLVQTYGEDIAYAEGFQIHTSCKLPLQKRAQEGVRLGLRNHDKRQGYRGPLEKIEEEMWEAKLREIKKDILKKHVRYRIVAGRELTTRPKEDAPEAASEPGAETEAGQEQAAVEAPEATEEIEPTEEGQSTLPEDPELTFLETEWFDALDEDKQKFYEKVGKTPLKFKTVYKAIVIEHDKEEESATVRVGDITGKIFLDDTKWARKPNPEQFWEWDHIRDLRRAFKKGDLIEVSLKRFKEEDIRFFLEQQPEAEAAILSMEVPSGFVQAMVGGYDFNRSEFNRAIQAMRQAGSTFKPIVYASGVDRGLTPATIIVDSPITYRDEDAEFIRIWKPGNFGQKFYGDTTYRNALINSRNIATIKIVQELGVPYISRYARHLGMTTPLNQDLSISLGSSSVYLHELVKTYALFANRGRKVDPIFIQRIFDREGNEILNTAAAGSDPSTELLKQTGPATQAEEEEKPNEEEDELNNETFAEVFEKKDDQLGVEKEEPFPLFESDDPHQRMSEQTAYIMSDLLKGVIEEGTGRAARSLGRPLAGKTGTTNDYIDAWFMGYSPQLVTGVWTGFDEKRTLGKLETGGRASLPIWMYYMRKAVKQYSIEDFQEPTDVVKVWIDSEDGRRATSRTKTRYQAAFVKGTEPGGEFAVDYITSLKEVIARKNGDKVANKTTSTTTGATSAEMKPNEETSVPVPAIEEDNEDPPDDFYRKEMGL